MLRHTYPFYHVVGTTAPSFQAGATNVFDSTTTKLESTSPKRLWAGPHGRAIRVSETLGADYVLALGSSTITAGGTTDSIQVLGGTVEIFRVNPDQEYVAVKSLSTSTGAKVNITLGYGQ